MKHKLKMERSEVLDEVRKAVSYAKNYCNEVEFSAEDASRSDKDFLVDVFTAAVDAGASIINVPDTVGYAMPWEYGELFSYLREQVPNINQAILSAHCHDDLGLAVANSIAAVQNGAQQIECTINGIGERAGNASLEEVVMAFATRGNDFEKTTNIETRQLYPASQLLEEISGQSVQVNKAIVGKNAFAHEAGIHQHGVLNNPLTYEIMTPESVGKTGNSIVLGKHSGRFALNKKLCDMGFQLAKDDLNQIYMRFTKLADDQKIVSEKELQELVAQTIPNQQIDAKAS